MLAVFGNCAPIGGRYEVGKEETLFFPEKHARVIQFQAG